MARKKTATAPAEALTTNEVVTTIKHAAKRKNIPAAGLEAQGRIEESPRIRHHYNPHLPPVLRSATDAAGADRLPELLQIARQRALSAEEAEWLAEALRRHEPWLEWSGKREKPWFEVEPVALHIHERVSTQAILKVLAREDVNRDLFADPQQSYAEAVQFYKYDVDWANRMILGDSLQVMASLARREDLVGKVQMIYVDPPYGIRFASNFQPQLGQRDVKDRESDLTREPEMVKAYRDTWTLGIHSYLAYLRDRLTMARELLADSGSIFVQISDENLHRVRCVMDEVFGMGNFVAVVIFRTTGGQASSGLAQPNDFLLWYSKHRDQMRYNQIFLDKRYTKDSDRFDLAEKKDTGEIREQNSIVTTDMDEWELLVHDNITSQGITSESSEAFAWIGREFLLPKNSHWKTTPEGMRRLEKANRLMAVGATLRFKRLMNDFAVAPLHADWDDTAFSGFGRKKEYVVETNTKVIERCLLMTTDPGDLVLDPTCGSGTTAYVAEQWGRRWITCDTSRVALALAKQRLLTARFTYYQLRPLNAEDLARNPKGAWLKNGDAEPRTFQCKTVPHITLKSIARNASLDPIFARHEPILAARLADLNTALAAHVTDAVHQQLAAKLSGKVRAEGVRAVTEADCRRWLLPGARPIHITEKKAARLRDRIPPQTTWREWEVPFDADPDWPQPLQEALAAYRTAWRAKMDAVNAAIAANAIMEELVDKPEEVKGVVRVSGPFTVEGVIALEDGLDTPIGGAPEELDHFDAGTGGAGDAAATNAEAHLDKVIRLLKASGVDFPSTPGAPAKTMTFARLEPLTDASLLHGEGEWASGGNASGGDVAARRVAVSIGPEVGNLTAWQVEDVVRSANRRGYDEVVFAAFGFDAAAQAAIEDARHPHLRLHMALIRPDVAMGELLKTQPGSQLFTVFSAPRVKPPQRQADGQYVVEVEGMDVYDPVSNALYPTDKERIAAWFLDSDYDGRTFCICQAFFPDKTKWARLARALGDRGVIDEDKFAALSGLLSLPFPRPARRQPGEPWRIAVKMIDPRGNEGLRVLTIPES